MPIREYKCSNCSYFVDEIMRGATYPHDMGKCPKCRKGSLYHTFAVSTTKSGNRLRGYTVDFVPGYDVGAGRYFETNSERHEWMARTGTKEDKGMSSSLGIVQDHRKLNKGPKRNTVNG